MQFAIQRGAIALVEEGKKDNAIELVDQYFDAFPNMNFEYGLHAAYMLGIYSQVDAYDKAKPHMQILARNIDEQLNYFMTLPEDILSLSYGNDFQAAQVIADRLVAYAQRAGDAAYEQELRAMFGPFLRPSAPMPQELPADIQERLDEAAGGE
jgi:hypothetical protein